ncbi:hypothetical protein HK102_009455 [Quaeritorhiza haematococci]|nr:hypothetical protein HK102_009455 [Quaeritorhiza haematococci]
MERGPVRTVDEKARMGPILEIKFTETNYHKKLLLLRDCYYAEIEKKFVQIPSLKMAFANKLSPNINRILELSEAILSVLHGDIDVVKFSELFAEKCAALKEAYSEYVSKYVYALELLRDIEEKHLWFKDFLMEIRLKTDSGSNFRSLLVEPVQRLPRYAGTFATILKNTPEDHPDFKTLEAAAELISQMVLAVNNTKKEGKTLCRGQL